MAKSKHTSTVEAGAIANIIRERVDAGSYVSLYVNDLQVTVTPWDFKFALGLVTETPTPESQTLTIRTIGDIRMSPQLAKRLLMVLDGQIKNYEASVGEIPLAPSE